MMPKISDYKERNIGEETGNQIVGNEKLILLNLMENEVLRQGCFCLCVCCCSDINIELK